MTPSLIKAMTTADAVAAVLDADRLSELLQRPVRAAKLRIKPEVSVLVSLTHRSTGLTAGWARLLWPVSHSKAAQAERLAASLGLRVGLCRFLALLCAALLAACAVSIGGLLSFVGLLVPHALRFLLGNDYRWLTPFSAVVGAIFLLLCDTLSRLLFAPYELPVGILLSFLGAPFFLWLLLGRKRRLAL